MRAEILNRRDARGNSPLVIALVLVGACDERCGKREVRVDPPAVVTASATPSAVPSASASASTGQAPAREPDDPDSDCKTAKDDALARYHAYCKAHEDDCRPLANDADPLGRGSTEPDLNGDGYPERSWGWGPMPVNVETHLYSGKRCAVHLATLPGNASVTALPTRHEGWADVSAGDTSHCEGMCNCTPDVHVFEFHGGQYREDPKRHVEGTATPCTP